MVKTFRSWWAWLGLDGLIIALLLLGAPATVVAGSVFAIAEFGVKLIPQAAVPSNCTSPDRTCLWTKSADNLIYYHKVDGTDASVLTTYPLSNGANTVTFNYGGPQTGTSTDFSFRSTNAQTVGDKFMSFGDTGELAFMSQTSSTVFELKSTQGNWCFRNSSASGLCGQGTSSYIYANGTPVLLISPTDVSPQGGQSSGANGAWASMKAQHFSGSGTAPTKAAGACIGGTQTVTLDAQASDAAGTITLTGTATGTASATCATITFTTAYATAPHCQLSASNAAASALSGTAAIFIDSASTTTALFVLKVGSTALVAGTYLYTYDCTQ